MDYDYLLLASYRGLHLVQGLATDGDDGLERRFSAGLGRAAGRVTLDHVDLALLRLARLAVRQLARQRRGLQQPLAPGQVARLPGGDPGPGRLGGLGDDVLAPASIAL